jgi:hypothetical protein
MVKVMLVDMVKVGHHLVVEEEEQDLLAETDL